MSGPICPDCGGLSITSAGGKGGDRCGVCAWSGPTLPRKILYGEDQARRAMRDAERARRKAAGKLFFVRVWVDGRSEARVTEAVMDLLGLESADHGEEYLLLESPAKPDDATLSAIRGMKGVKRVEVV